MSKTLRLTRYLALTATVASLIGLGIGLRTVTAKEVAANDCLVGVENEAESQLAGTVSCTDCDPACDTDGVATANGTCKFSVRGCINIPGVAGCALRPLKKFKFKTQNDKTLIKVNPPTDPTQATSACGAFVSLEVGLKKKGKKAGKRTVIATAQANVKPAGKNKDMDKITFVCNPLPAGDACPTTTTTTTSTTTTTIPSGICNDGTTLCDPAVPTTCPSGPCTSCGTASGTLSFTTGTNVSSNCGGVGLQPDAVAPTTGTVTVRDLTMMTNTVLNLGAGCLYVGGGASTVPGGATPDGSTSIMDVRFSCPDTNNTLIVGPHTGDIHSCTAGAGPGMSCINDLTNFPTLTPCTTDAECSNIAGACVLTPNCLFGPPLPIQNGPLSTCVINTFATNIGGVIAKTTGSANLSFPLFSHTFVTGTSTPQPCPQCVSNLCVGGTRDGLACTPVGTQLTTIDCPPGGPYLPEFPVTLNPLSTGTVNKSDPGGIFCPGQGSNPGDGAAGFGGTNVLGGPSGTDLVNVAIAVEEVGSPAGDISDNAPHAATLASVFCIPATGNALIDGAASLPGPGAVSLPGSIQLQ